MLIGHLCTSSGEMFIQVFAHLLIIFLACFFPFRLREDRCSAFRTGPLWEGQPVPLADGQLVKCSQNAQGLPSPAHLSPVPRTPPSKAPSTPALSLPGHQGTRHTCFPGTEYQAPSLGGKPRQVDTSGVTAGSEPRVDVLLPPAQPGRAGWGCPAASQERGREASRACKAI